MDKYILVTWSEIQYFMDHPDYKENVFLGVSFDKENTNSYWFVSEWLYNEIMG